MNESVVEIRGSKYRYIYDSDTKETIYLGPVGNSPVLTEEEFHIAATKKMDALVVPPEQAKENKDLIRNVNLPKMDFIKVTVYPNTVRFRIEDPKNFEPNTFFVLDGRKLKQYGWKPGKSWTKQPRKLKREFVHHEGEFRWVEEGLRATGIRELGVDEDSFLVLADHKKDEKQKIQAIVRRTEA
jgi:hypothetical protein